MDSSCSQTCSVAEGALRLVATDGPPRVGRPARRLAGGAVTARDLVACREVTRPVEAELARRVAATEISAMERLIAGGRLRADPEI